MVEQKWASCMEMNAWKASPADLKKQQVVPKEWEDQQIASFRPLSLTFTHLPSTSLLQFACLLKSME